MSKIKKFIIVIIIIAAAVFYFSYEDFKSPKWSEVQSMTVQEYANAQPVSRELEMALPDYGSSSSQHSVINSLCAKDIRRTKDPVSAGITQALLYRVYTKDGKEYSFFVFPDPKNDHTATYFEKPDGKLWKSDDNCLKTAYSNYQNLSFSKAFKDDFESLGFHLLPEYNGLGKILPFEYDTDYTNPVSMIRADIQWNKWDGTGTLELPCWVWDSKSWNKFDSSYLANRAEDVRYIVISHVASQEYAYSMFNSVTNKWEGDVYHKDYGYTVYDLVTGEESEFTGTDDEARANIIAYIEKNEQ